MRLGFSTFFYSGEIDGIIDMAIDLALLFKCDVFTILERDGHFIESVYGRVGKRLKQREADRGLE